MNRFNSTVGRTVYPVRETGKSVVRKPWRLWEPWGASTEDGSVNKTILLQQGNPRRCRGACLFTCIQVRRLLARRWSVSKLTNGPQELALGILRGERKKDTRLTQTGDPTKVDGGGPERSRNKWPPSSHDLARGRFGGRLHGPNRKERLEKSPGNPEARGWFQLTTWGGGDSMGKHRLTCLRTGDRIPDW
jgi:hypothetical protein